MHILIADDHQLFLDGLTILIKGVGQDVYVTQAVSVGDIKEKLHKGMDLVLIDLRMPGMKGKKTLEALMKRVPNIPFVVISATESQADIDACLESGVKGFIPKATPSIEMIDIVKRVLAGAVHHPQLKSKHFSQHHDHDAQEEALPAIFTSLSERQLQVLLEMAKGFTNKEIASVLNISNHTVKTHIAHLFSVFRVSSRVECVQKARSMGVL